MISSLNNENDNLMLTKIWQDSVEDFMELQIVAKSALACASQDSCYIMGENLHILSERIISFCNSSHTSCVDCSDFLQDFSFKLVPKDELGHVYIEVGFNISDIPDNFLENYGFEHKSTFL